MDFDWMDRKLRDKLTKTRYTHTIGVMYTAASLAMAHKTDVQQALIAGLLHDCGKFGHVNDQIAICMEYKIPLESYELEMPALVHAKLGAYLAKHEYKIEDDAICNAILYHTTGRPNMSLLEKILYIADYIEPWRQELPEMAEIRQYAFTDIDRAIEAGARGTIAYLTSLGRKINPLTIQTMEYYGIIT